MLILSIIHLKSVRIYVVVKEQKMAIKNCKDTQKVSHNGVNKYVKTCPEFYDKQRYV